MKTPSSHRALLFLFALSGLVQPDFAVAAPICVPAPFGKNALFLRGTISNWIARDEYEFRYQCDAYYLNVKLDGKHEFKIAEESWLDASTIGNSETHTSRYPALSVFWCRLPLQLPQIVSVT